MIQETSIAFSGSIPMNYEKYLGPLFFEPFAKNISNRVKELQPSSVLELACGTGRLTKYLPFAISPGGRIVATDINPAMLEYAKHSLRDLEGIDWKVVDAVELPFRDNCFDVVVIQFGVMFFSDRHQAFTEALRVLKPGGTLIFSSWDQLRNNPVARVTDELVTRYFPMDTPGFYKIPFSYFNEHKIHEELDEALFHNVSIELLKLYGESKTAAEAAMGLLQGSPIHTAIVERNASVLPVMIEQLTEEIASLFGKKNLSIPIQALVTTARKK